MIKTDGLTKRYGTFAAVENVSFSIPQGQIVGLLGHNGAGKTTILKMLTGYIEPTEGTITVDDLDVVENRLEVQQRIGYLPENCPLYPEMSVIQYLDYVSMLRDLPEDTRQKSVVNALERTALSERALAQVGVLSKGYRQRLGVAAAMLHRPRILVLDEPTSGLDPSQINHMRTLVRELAQDATVILSTHILQEVEAVCDRVIILVRGKIALDSNLDEVRSSNRLLLGVDRGLNEVKTALGQVAGIRSVSALDTSGDVLTYALEIENGRQEVASSVSRAVVEYGMRLFSIQSERRTLESIFGELGSGRAGEVHEE